MYTGHASHELEGRGRHLQRPQVWLMQVQRVATARSHTHPQRVAIVRWSGKHQAQLLQRVRRGLLRCDKASGEVSVIEAVMRGLMAVHRLVHDVAATCVRDRETVSQCM